MNLKNNNDEAARKIENALMKRFVNGAETTLELISA